MMTSALVIVHVTESIVVFEKDRGEANSIVRRHAVVCVKWLSSVKRYSKMWCWVSPDRDEKAWSVLEKCGADRVVKTAHRDRPMTTLQIQLQRAALTLYV